MTDGPNIERPACGAGLSGHGSSENDPSRSKNRDRQQHRRIGGIHLGHHHRRDSGGNRLDHFRQLLLGDQRSVETLPDTSPRKRPTLARLRFQEGAR